MSSYDFLKYFDGTDKKPRQVQTDALEWIQDQLTMADILVLQCPVGGGKSAIAKAIQNITNSPIITPSNILIDQYTKDYPEVNSLKGKAHYSCDDGLSCLDKVDLLGETYCADCPYQCAKGKAIAGAATFYNPMSLFYASQAEDWKQPLITVVDEAHMLAGMVLLMAGKRFDGDRYDITKTDTTVNGVSKWLQTIRVKMGQLASIYKNQGDLKKAVEIERDRQNAYYILEGLRQDPDNYAIWKEKGKNRGRYTEFLNIKPIKPPEFLTKQLLPVGTKAILMSGTVFDYDIEDLFPGRNYKILDLPSPIPKEQRQLILNPVSYKMNWQTPPEQIADSIKEVLAAHPGENAIIHVSYAMSRKLEPHMPDGVLVNTAENKIQMLNRFKKEGGVFLAAGCAEGIDLKGDLCRLNIIPKLLYPNLVDPVVKKRMAQAGGADWYDLETLKLLIQQAGRSTRCLDDFSKTYILDPGAAWRIKKHRKKLPQSFLEAIVLKK